VRLVLYEDEMLVLCERLDGQTVLVRQGRFDVALVRAGRSELRLWTTSEHHAMMRFARRDRPSLEATLDWSAQPA
jgi:hypothetical protein